MQLNYFMVYRKCEENFDFQQFQQISNTVANLFAAVSSLHKQNQLF